MVEKKTLFISDLDGTLLNGSAELSEYTLDTLNALIGKGMHFSVATARTLASSAKILDGLALRLPIVLQNGVLIYDMGQKRYAQINYCDPATVAAVLGILKQHETTGFLYELKDGELMTYHESLEKKPLRDFVEERIARYYRSFKHTDSFSAVSLEQIVYITLLDTYERLKPVHDAANSLVGLSTAFYNDVYKPDLWYLEMFSAKSSKKNGVDYLRKEHGYERIVGFGDNLNDLPLFEACDVRVAVGNARPEVKAAADFICDANDSDGVAKWLVGNVL
jgi:Cof subfamily protein (haloacid dehalogenase superfamily)